MTRNLPVTVLEHRSAYKWFLVGLLWLVGCLNYMDRQAIFSVFPLLKKELGMSDTGLALLGSFFLWAYGVSSPLAGYAGDRFRRKNVVLSSLLIFSIATFAVGAAKARWQLISLRGLLGVSEALYIPVALAFIADYHSSRTRSTAIGIHQTSLLLGAILGGVFAGYMGDHHEWRLAFYALGGVGILLAAVMVPLLRETRKGASDSWLSQQIDIAPGKPVVHTVGSVLNKRTVLCIMFCGMSVSMVGWAVMAWMPLYLYEKFGMNLMHAGLNATFYVSVASMAGMLSGSLLADYWARRNPRARMMVQLIGLGVTVPAVLAVGGTTSVTILLVSLVLFGLGRGLWDVNNMPIFCEVVPPEVRSSAYGLLNLANTLGGGLSVLLVGVLIEALGIGASLSSLSLILLISVGVTSLGVLRFLPIDMRNLRKELAEGAR